jgi:cell fate (sporulation/competence/biofilm development) regulator YlbF (YheA/YmcA/DUF963 family)
VTNEEARQRGITADRLLRDEAFQDAFTALEADYIAAWRTGKTVEHRESAHRHLVVLEKVKAHLHSAVTSGQSAEERITEAQGAKSRWF